MPSLVAVQFASTTTRMVQRGKLTVINVNYVVLSLVVGSTISEFFCTLDWTNFLRNRFLYIFVFKVFGSKYLLVLSFVLPLVNGEIGSPGSQGERLSYKKQKQKNNVASVSSIEFDVGVVWLVHFCIHIFTFWLFGYPIMKTHFYKIRPQILTKEAKTQNELRSSFSRFPIFREITKIPILLLPIYHFCPTFNFSYLLPHMFHQTQ